MYKNLWIAAAFAAFASSATAAPVAYTDRAAFQAALSSFTVDNLNDVTDGYKPVGLNRGAYAFDMPSFGCNSGPGQCGDNTADGFFYPAYIWTYGNGSFTFGSTIYGFGLDFGDYNDTASVTLNGQSASATHGGFLGIIDSAGFTSVAYSAEGSGSLFDNVTFGTGAANMVPEPGSMALVGLGLLGLLGRRRQSR